MAKKGISPHNKNNEIVFVNCRSNYAKTGFEIRDYHVVFWLYPKTETLFNISV